MTTPNACRYLRRQSSAQKAARERNFAIYRVSGMIANLSSIYYTFRDDYAITDTLSDALDAAHEVLKALRKYE